MCPLQYAECMLQRGSPEGLLSGLCATPVMGVGGDVTMSLCLGAVAEPQTWAVRGTLELQDTLSSHQVRKVGKRWLQVDGQL